jgi:hypothetical protein
MAFNKTLVFQCLVGVGLVVSGCGGSSGSAVDTTISQTCMLDAQTFCEKRKTCWPDGLNDFRFQRDWGGSLDTCVEERKRSCLQDLERPMSGNTAARASSCAHALQTQSCPDFLQGLALPTSDCPPVVGHIENAAACAVSNQCKSNYCDRAENQRCGKCADKGGIGARCDQNSDCASSLTCQLTADGTGMACAPAVPAVPKLKVGEACGMPGQAGCDTALACVGVAPTKTCMAQVATEGAPCDPSKKMLPDCDNTTVHLWCNTATKLCEKRKWAPMGEPCNELPDGTFAGCSAGGNCVRAKDALGKRTTTGTCIKDAIENEPCYRDTADGPACAVPLRCIYDSVGASNGVCLSADYTMCSLPVPTRDGGTSAMPDAGTSD